MRDIIRHGDVLLKRIDKLPDYLGAAKQRKSKVILNGEVTGHSHRICDGETQILDYYETTWRSTEPVLRASYLQVETPATITHEEHGPLPLTIGIYEIVRAREFDYAANLGRNVRD